MSHHPNLEEWTAEELLREDHSRPLRPYVEPKRTSSGKKKQWALLAGVALVIAIAVGVAVPLTVKKRKGSSGTGTSSSSSSLSSGTSGSSVTQEDGTTFTYTNNFGGDWAFDPQAPFGSGGKAQSWSKRIGGEQWVWGKDIVRGVNLGSAVNPFFHDALFKI
jgi:hypothetical protein